jgi:ABC-type branched-subunit amino acid transport system substrate-binding protein
MDRRTFMTSTAVALSTATSAHAADPGITDNEILLGQSAVLSGPLSVGAIAARDGARLVFDEVNAHGGIAERRVRLQSLDDALQPAKAAENYRALVTQHRVFACVQGIGAATTQAGLPVLRDAGVPLLGAVAVGDTVRDAGAGVAYYTRASQLRECEALVEHLSTVGIRRIAVAYMATPGGEEVLRQLTVTIDKRGAQLSGKAAIAPDGRNAAEGGQQLAALRPQAVILFLSGAPAAALLTAMKQHGASPAYYGMSILSGEVTAKLLGGRAMGLAISQVTPYPWDGANTDAARYREAAGRAGVPVGYHSYEGYLLARVMVEALGRLGRDLTRARLHASIRSLKLRLAGTDFDFTGGRHTGSRFVELVHVRDNGSFAR